VSAPLLTVRDLTVLSGGGRHARVLAGPMSFEMGAERVALVGESGAGKSLTARALLGLLPAPLRSRAGVLTFGSTDLTQCSAAAFARLRGSQLALVLQNPRSALNPALTVGTQLDEMLRLHTTLPRKAREARILDMLDRVGLPDTARVLRARPHQLSGGMGQRAVIAMMLLNEPRLLIADEPTAALDVGLREQIMTLLCDLVGARGMGLLLITHDLRQVARHCERALVMYRGRVVDTCAAADLPRSTHPYTRTLWSCHPGRETYGTVLPVLDRSWAGEAT
jgi:peptide/nickel transport system ATP-binding protein